MTPTDIILRFDAEFDIPFRHNEAIGELMKLGAYEALDVNKASTEELALFAGAEWCRMINHDVKYELGDAISAFLSSQDAANRLTSLLDADKGHAQMFEAFTAARWHDGAGKCQFRVSRFREAAKLFTTALAVVKNYNLYWILPDIKSNQIRAGFDANRVAAGGTLKGETEQEKALLKQLRADYEEAIDDAGKIAGTHGLPFTAGRLETGLPGDLSCASRSFLRGCASLLHNYSLLPLCVLARNEKLIASERSADICLALGDGYRRAQALNQQQIIYRESSDPSEIDKARKLLAEMQNGRWARGRQIARQSLALMDGRQGRANQAMEEFQRLFDEIDASRRKRGSDFGLDLEFPHFTVGAASEVAERTDELRRSEWRQFLARERLKTARSLRKVVTLSEDKFSYSEKMVQPAYRPEIGKLITELSTVTSKQDAESVFDQIIALVEESRSREVLDLVALNRRKPITPKAIAPEFQPEPATILKASRNRPELRKTLRKSMNISSLDKVRARAQDYSAELLQRPIDVETVDPDSGHRIRRLAANNPGLCIISYFLHGDQKSLQLGAVVVLDNWQKVLNNFDYAAIKALHAAAIKQVEPSAPTFEQCKQLHELAFKPIFDALPQDRELAGMVIIPAGALFELPLQVAWDSQRNAPLAELTPIILSVSLNSLLKDGRFLLLRQYVEPTDDLCAMIVGSPKEDFGYEIANINWPSEHFFVAGRTPSAMVHAHRRWLPDDSPSAATWSAMLALCDVQPEFLIFSGHGDHCPDRKDIPALLQIQTRDYESDYISELDVAARLRLQHNKLSVISACVVGLGAARREGEVAGFIRSFMAADCGLLGLTLWPVLAVEIERAANSLLKTALKAMNTSKPINFAEKLQQYYRRRGKKIGDDPQRRIEACPLLLYI